MGLGLTRSRLLKTERALLERIRKLERLMSDPDAEPTQKELELWDWFVHQSQPAHEPGLIWDEGEPEPAPTANEVAWDRWYATPIADSFPRLAFPPRRGKRPRSAKQRARSRRARRARARSPGRPADDDDPDLDGPGAAA